MKQKPQNPFDTTDLEKEIEYEKIKGGIIKSKGRPRKRDIRYSDEQFIHLDGRKGIAGFGILLANERLKERQRLRKEVEKILKEWKKNIAVYDIGRKYWMFREEEFNKLKVWLFGQEEQE